MISFKPEDNILDCSKLKQIADILKCILNEKKVSYRLENILRNGEIAISPFLSVYSTTIRVYLWCVKMWCGSGLKSN